MAFKILSVCLVLMSRSFAQEHAPNPRFTFEISKQTTFVTRPVTAEGFVNLTAAINQKYSNGVDPGMNAAVPLIRCLGSKPGEIDLEGAFFEELGISTPSSDAYFQNYENYLGSQIGDQSEAEIVLDQISEAMLGPWTQCDNPKVYEWLGAQTRFLHQIEQSSKRPHYYRPLVGLSGNPSNGQGLFCVLLPDVYESRRVAEAFIARAMLYLGEGNTKNAWQDVITTIRLGRHIGSGPTLNEGLAGCAIESMGNSALIEIVQSTQLKESTFVDFANEYRQLPGRTRFSEKIAFFERLAMVDLINILANGNEEANDVLQFVDGLPKLKKLVSQPWMLQCDYNEALRAGNGWYDQIEKILHIQSPVNRKPSLQLLKSKMKQFETDLKSSKIKVEIGLSKGERVGRIVGNLVVRQLLLESEWENAQSAEDQIIQKAINIKTLFALQEYRARTGGYPESLSQLVPENLESIPVDIFSNGHLAYQKTRKGFKLYSFGINQTDDSGNDRMQGSDDLIIEIP